AGPATDKAGPKTMEKPAQLQNQKAQGVLLLPSLYSHGRFGIPDASSVLQGA
ncbi:hypothetical protein Droror1_Dr00008034, partial [Drosera rotundifolia]